MTKDEKSNELGDLLKKKTQELRQELAGINPIRPETKEVVEKHLRDSVPLDKAEFPEKGNKNGGVSEGYISTNDGNTFILKPFKMDPKDCTTHKEVTERRDGVNEVIASTLYQAVLYGRAPKEGIVLGAADDENLYVRSKFFKDAATLSAYSGIKDPKSTRIDSYSEKLKNIDGFEKAIAACHTLGEIDYHAGNLMVVDGGTNAEGIKEKGTVVKIDHGRSFLDFPKGFVDMAEKTHKMFSNPGVGYTTAIESGNLSFDPKKYSNALAQMTLELTDDQITSMVEKRSYELRQADLNPTGIYPSLDADIKFKTDKMQKELEAKGIDHAKINKELDKLEFDLLEEHYKQKIISARDSMKKIAQDVEIISKFEFQDKDMEEKFKNGGWLEEAATHNVGPIELAIKLGANIEALDPIAFAEKNGVEIEGNKPEYWAVAHGEELVDQFIGSGGKINGQDPVAWAVKNDVTLHGRKPKDWAIENGAMIVGMALAFESTIEGKKPIDWAIENGVEADGKKFKEYLVENFGSMVGYIKPDTKIEGKHYMAWLIENDVKIDGENPIKWYKDNGLEIDGMDPQKWLEGYQKQLKQPSNHAKTSDIRKTLEKSKEHYVGSANRAVTGKQIKGGSIQI